MANPVPAAQHARANPDPVDQLRCRVRLADGRMFTGELPAERHRALQLGLLHSQSDGLVELAAGRREHGKLSITTRPRPPRTRPDHFLPGGASGKQGWLEGLLALADRHAKRGEEVFIAPAGRSHARGQTSTPSVTPTRCGSTSTAPDSFTTCGRSSPNAHATSYWRAPAAEESTATGSWTSRCQPRRRSRTGEVLEPIERAHLRLIHHLGVDDRTGKPNVADTPVQRPQQGHAPRRDGEQ